MGHPAVLDLHHMDGQFALWRVWAADVRDRQRPHRGLSAEQAGKGGLLARLLDSWQEQSMRAASPDSAGNLALGLEASIAELVRQLLASGVTPPILPV